jgi:hypothetical protein
VVGKRLVLIATAGILTAIGAGYGLLRLPELGSADACLSEELAAIPNLLDAKFEVIYTNCDTLAKDEAIRVYVSPAVVAGKSWFASWQKERELVFQYDPGMDRSPPAIEASGNNGVLISVSDVSSISVQRRTWRNISISYRILHVVYP